MKQGTQSQGTGTTQRDGIGRGVRDQGTHVHTLMLVLIVFSPNSKVSYTYRLRIEGLAYQ